MTPEATNSKKNPTTPRTEERTCSLVSFGSVFGVFGLTPPKKNEETEAKAEVITAGLQL